MSGATVPIVLADTHPLFLDALAREVRSDGALDLVATATSLLELRSLVNEHRPKVVAADSDLVRLGLAASPPPPGALERDDLPRLLLLADDPAPEHVFSSLERGYAGCISKDASGEAVRRAIIAVAAGQTLLDPHAQTLLAREIRLRGKDDRPLLTPREQQVLGLMAAGRTAPSIARSLHLSTATVKTHLLHLYEKLGVTERAAAVAEAMRWGLLE